MRREAIGRVLDSVMRLGVLPHGPDVGAPASGDQAIELGTLGQTLLRRKWWILLPTLLAGALAFVGVNLVTPRYKSEARVLIDARENVFLRPEAEKAADRNVIDQEAVTSQVKLALSRDLGRQVM